MKRTFFLALTLCLAAVSGFAAACSDDTRADDDGGSDGDGDSDGDADSDSDSDTSSDGCSEAAKKVYVIDGNDKALYSFDPPNKAFNKIGVVACQGAGSPYSMAVARDGTAYVLFWDDAGACKGLYKISTADASCIEKTPFACGQQTFSTFGMGFATDGANTAAETLYVGKTTSAYKLGKIDLGTWALSPIGLISGAPEMTGNGAGELWAFFAWTTPPKVAQFDKATGVESNTVQLSQLQGNAAFAFAFYGGSFYLFHAPSGDTAVWKLTGSTLESYMPTTGIYVVGAGVSTCAPLSPE
jgi:hypothetical protein